MTSSVRLAGKIEEPAGLEKATFRQLDGRAIKAIPIKTPPQAQDDTKLLNLIAGSLNVTRATDGSMP
ncbi:MULTISPECIES: hypothetical protein [Bradyrhizobium]|uniref:Uncharacterized protein n=1 Tax=Bradyrhizobium elkanii TaxID=29448 RepID=A0A4U6S254_BRAEL|nr:MULTISPECIES: hypothetical protein [Bradyrhizobium]MTV15512.1 hypothetical protein [Bradyrhizobium sp. BR2003]TKV81230.1 hypothetical protein FDV58_14030 [Bradyrhizobium elkanii]